MCIVYIYMCAYFGCITTFKLKRDMYFKKRIPVFMGPLGSRLRLGPAAKASSQGDWEPQMLKTRARLAPAETVRAAACVDLSMCIYIYTHIYIYICFYIYPSIYLHIRIHMYG